MADNPLELIYDAFWVMLEDNSDFASEVPAGNRIKYTGTTEAPEKDEVSGADFPEVRVVCAGSKPHLQRTSNGSSWNTIWEIQIATGDQRFEAGFKVQWPVYCALSIWETRMKALTYGGNAFVTLCRPLSTEDSLTNQDLNRGIRGWSAIWRGELEMWFQTSALQAEG